MRRVATPLVLMVCVAAGLVLQPTLRRSVLALIRLPLTATEGVCRVLVELPRLPSLGRQHAQLREQLTAQQLELGRLREMVRHSTRAAQLAAAAPGSTGQVARIIGRTILPTQHVVMLNRGAPDAVLLDSAGVAGRVLEATPTTSTGLLLTDPNSRIACLVERSRESALLVGTGGRLCHLQYLDLDADVDVGDRIVTAGLGGPFPKGLPLGAVVKVDRDERNARMRAWVRPFVRVHQLEEVLCIPPSDQSVVRSP